MKTKLSTRISDILSQYPEYRDSDYLLLSRIWQEDLKEIEPPIHAELFQLTKFFEYLEQGKLTNSESVRRCRQLLMEEYPVLRGKSYKSRKRKGEEYHKHSLEGNLTKLLDKSAT